MPGNIVDINEYRRSCDNCFWHDGANGACKHPGGYEWDMKFSRCATFRWRNGYPASKTQGGEEHDTQL